MKGSHRGRLGVDAESSLFVTFNNFLTYIFATISGPIMEEVIDMTHKQIDASREARLWLTQVVLPVVGLVMMVPETRQIALAKASEMKAKIEAKFKK